jgi:F-type H+-transporting ATPase subunit epsilon
MADTFPFRLIMPTGAVFEGEVEQAVASSSLGEFGVLANHIDFITSLLPCVLTLKLPGGAGFIDYVVTGGLATVRNSAMTVLADDVQHPDRLERDAVMSELRTAEERLGAMSVYDPTYPDALQATHLARARARAIQPKRA